LPVGLLAEGGYRRGRLRFMLRTAGLHLPLRKARPRASTPRSPRTSAGYYKGDLVPPLAGLPPASHRELSGCTGCAPRRQSLRSVAPSRGDPPHEGPIGNGQLVDVRSIAGSNVH